MDSQSQFLNVSEDGGLARFFDSPDFDPAGVGLALSGGGYKAAAFHLGALIRLNELGWLKRLTRISSVSGGSIVSGYLGLKWKDLAFDSGGVAVNFDEVITGPLHRFLTTANLDFWAGLLGLFPFLTGAGMLACGYRDHLYGDASLQDLPHAGEGPEFVIAATNYELKSLWRFSQAYAADYRVGMIDAPRFPLSQIVAASSGFPPFFCPLKLDVSGAIINPTEGADRHAGRFLHQAQLCDGGVYDNMALEPVWKECGTLLVSNAGDPFDENSHPGNWFCILLRILGMIHRQAENNRQRVLMLLANLGERTVAYWPLRNSNNNYPKPSQAIPPQADIAAAQAVKVRLWSLTATAFNQLANHGYSLCDSAAQSYLDLGAAPPPRPPFGA